MFHRHLPPHPEKLYVIAVMSNPVMFASRARLANEFVAQLKRTPNVVPVTVELAFGGRGFELTEVGDIHLQLRARDEVWHKENMINLALQRLPLEARKVAWVDADVEFRDPLWATATLHALETYRIVQPFETCVDAGPQDQVIQVHKSFGSQFVKGAPRGGAYGQAGEFWHPGYAWAARRETLDALGGLIDWAILGAGDHHMALAFIGDVEASLPGKLHPNYDKLARRFQARADQVVQRDLGYAAGTLWHHWHGKKANRKYVERWSILQKFQYDPEVDVLKDTQGVLQLAGNKPAFRDALRSYFRQRSEDSNEL